MYLSNNNNKSIYYVDSIDNINMQWCMLYGLHGISIMSIQKVAGIIFNYLYIQFLLLVGTRSLFNVELWIPP